jgi:hypothetical protein
MTDLHKTVLIAALLGIAGLAIGLWIDAKTAFASYLVVWTAIGAIPIGALAVLFTTYLVRAGWTHDLRGLLSAAALTIPIVAILFIPVLVGMTHIYPWATDASHLPPFKAVYLTPWFFVLRTVFYFAALTALGVWGALAYGDETAMKRSASAGLIVWALISSLAGIDWLQSVEPQFHSSIYGLLKISFDLLAGLGFAVAALLLTRATRQMSNAAYSGTFLSVLLLWAYLHAMQYIIIWAGNIPEEVVWYLDRLKDGWGFALWALFILQFIIPFFALLSERVRASTNALLLLAAATLALRFLEAAVLILPPLNLVSAALWLDLPAAILACGAVWLFAWQSAGRLLQEKLSGRVAPARQ